MRREEAEVEGMRRWVEGEREMNEEEEMAAKQV